MRVCTVCRHGERGDLEAALLGGSSLRDIATRFGLSKDAVARHRRFHLPTKLVKAAEQHEIAEADGLLASMEGLVRETLSVLTDAREARNSELRLKCVARLESQIRLQTDLLAQVAGRPSTATALDQEIEACLKKRDRALLAEYGIVMDPEFEPAIKP